MATGMIGGFRPLAGCGLFPLPAHSPTASTTSFRPLAGCGLFPRRPTRRGASICFRPLAGCGLFLKYVLYIDYRAGFRPLAGCGLFPRAGCERRTEQEFPSPCGVWVVSYEFVMEFVKAYVSVPLRGVGCFL